MKNKETLNQNYLQFSSGEEMLNFIQTGHDLYSAAAKLYVFLYNESGSIAYYNLNIEEAQKLASSPSVLNGECWGGCLGPGGWICDDPSYSGFEENVDISNLDFCNEHFNHADWILTEQLLVFYPMGKGNYALDETAWAEQMKHKHENLEQRIATKERNNHKIKGGQQEKLGVAADTTKGLIEAMAAYGLENTFCDSDIIDALVGLGITEEDFVRCGYGDFVKGYFDERDINDLILNPGAQTIEYDDTKHFYKENPGKEKHSAQHAGLCNGKKALTLREFLGYFDFDYIVYQNDNASENNLRVRLHIDGDLCERDINKPLVGLIDRQGADYGEIESSRFLINEELVGSIIERMDIYINDYVMKELKKALEDGDRDTSKMDLGDMVLCRKELGMEYGVLYEIANAILHPDTVVVPELDISFAVSSCDYKKTKTTLEDQIQSAGVRIEAQQQGRRESTKDHASRQ